MRRLISRAAVVVLTLFVLSGAAGTAAQDADGQLVELEVAGSPLVRGSGERLEATVTLAQPASLRLRVTDFDGRLVRELFEGPQEAGTSSHGWFGRGAELQRLPDGPYRLVATATADGVTERAHAWVTVAQRPVYPQAPASITVAVDPGHGGSLSGAVGSDGTREADINLDVGLRLARMLEGAGVDVVITRTTDAFVNEPREDRTGDGVIDDTDELAARPDKANLARADLFISIHNNIAVNESVGGPSTFYFDERTFAPRSLRLARTVQEEMVRALSEAVGGNWQPYDHGALIYPYYVLRDYDPPRLKRPTQMPGVLSEGMFLSNERELALLQRPAIRGAMANGYYEAVAKYLARRGTHVGYELISGPTEPVPAGAAITYAVEVRNQGTETIRNWRLPVSVVGAPARYVGRLREGEPAGGARIPRLEPGQSALVEVEVAAPGTGGEWALLFSARDRGGRRAAEMGSPMLQVPLTTLDPPQPSPASSAEPAS